MTRCLSLITSVMSTNPSLANTSSSSKRQKFVQFLNYILHRPKSQKLSTAHQSLTTKNSRNMKSIKLVSITFLNDICKGIILKCQPWNSPILGISVLILRTLPDTSIISKELQSLSIFCIIKYYRYLYLPVKKYLYSYL